jgi:hypothetical protein
VLAPELTGRAKKVRYGSHNNGVAQRADSIVSLSNKIGLMDTLRNMPVFVRVVEAGRFSAADAQTIS